MDWIVTTGATVEAALDVALDELSVTQEDIEFEVVEKPKSSIFGFRRKQAQGAERPGPGYRAGRGAVEAQRCLGDVTARGTRGAGSRPCPCSRCCRR